MKVSTLTSSTLFKQNPTALKYSLSHRIGENKPAIKAGFVEYQNLSSDITTIKNANAAIGSLETMIKGIENLQSQTKSLAKISNKTQKNDKNLTELSTKAQNIKAQMKETFEATAFQDENVFNKNYQTFAPNIKVNGKRLLPNSLDVNQLQSIKEYANALNEEKLYAKQAKEILQKNVNSLLEQIYKTDSVFEQLNDSSLQSDDFKATYSSGLTLDRIINILG